MAAAFRDRFRRRAADTEPEPSADEEAEVTDRDHSADNRLGRSGDSRGIGEESRGGGVGTGSDVGVALESGSQDVAGDMGVRAGDSVDAHAGGDVGVRAGEEVDTHVGGEVGVLAGDSVDAHAGGDVHAEDEGGEWLAYELHEWSLESRVMLQQLLTVDKVVHSWQGTTLMVHESLEEAVDSLVDEVEETERAKEATSRPIGPDDELTAFELGEWPEELRTELVELLVQARVPHVIDTQGEVTDPEVGGAGEAQVAAEVAEEAAAVSAAAGGSEVEGVSAAVGGGEVERAGAALSAGAAQVPDVCDLLVREVDEERVELLIDDLLAREEEAQFEELDGLQVNDLLSALFVACDRLRRDPGEVGARRAAATHARRLVGVRTPFGFTRSSWRDLRNAVGELLDSTEGAGTDSAEIDSEDLRELAHRMSDTLRALV